MRGGISRPDRDGTGKRQGTSQGTGRTTAQPDKGSLSRPSPAVPPVDDMPLSATCSFLLLDAKSSLFRELFFMRCRFRPARSQQKQGWMERQGLFPPHGDRRPCVPRPCRGVASADNTRWRRDGSLRNEELLPRCQRPDGGRRPYPLRRRKLRASTATRGGPLPLNNIQPRRGAGWGLPSP